MMHALSPALQKTCALLLLAAGLLGLYAVAVAPLWRAIVLAQDTIETDRAALGRLIEHAQASTSNPSVAAAPTRDEAFLPGASNAGRVANLQSRIGKIADTLSIDVKSRREIPLEDRDGILFLGIELIVTADNKALLDFLRVVEAERPRLFVDTLGMAPASIAREASEDSEHSSRQTIVVVTLRIVGAVDRGNV